MVTENDRLWAVPREFLKRPGQTPVDRLETVRVPTLILIGENDQGQKAPAELLARRIPRARIVRVSDGGHLLNLTSPREFQEAVSAFLSR